MKNTGISTAVSYDEFRNVRWDFDKNGEIVTDRPEYIPMIREYLDGKVYRNPETLQAFIEKYGGVWLESELVL